MPILAITDDSLLFTVQGIFTQHRCVALLCFQFAIQRPHSRALSKKEGGPLKYFRSATPIKHFNLSTLLNSWPLVRWRLPRRGKSDGLSSQHFKYLPHYFFVIKMIFYSFYLLVFLMSLSCNQHNVFPCCQADRRFYCFPSICDRNVFFLC